VKIKYKKKRENKKYIEKKNEAVEKTYLVRIATLCLSARATVAHHFTALAVRADVARQRRALGFSKAALWNGTIFVIAFFGGVGEVGVAFTLH
jgi:hypothetical protein